jgi:hypothetical protein
MRAEAREARGVPGMWSTSDIALLAVDGGDGHRPEPIKCQGRLNAKPSGTAMQTFLLIWVVSSAAIFTAATIVRSGGDSWQQEKGRVAVLAAFWPPILTGLLISFLIWFARHRSLRVNSL